MSTPIDKGPTDLVNSQKDAENSTPSSRVKRKVKKKKLKSKSAAVNEEPVAAVESSETLACAEAESLDDRRQDDEPELGKNESQTPKLSCDIENTQGYLTRNIEEGWANGEGEGDEGQRYRQRNLLSLQSRLQWLTNRHRTVHPRARAVSSYKDWSSAKFSKGKR